jgi:hypothetical protein
MTRGTMAAFGPMAIPMMSRVSGIRATISIIKGMDRPMLVIQPNTAFSDLCGQIPRGCVINRKTPSGIPKT